MNHQLGMNCCWDAETKRVKTTLNTQVHSSKLHLRDYFITLQSIAKTDTIRIVLEILVFAFFFKGCWKHGENNHEKYSKVGAGLLLAVI